MTKLFAAIKPWIWVGFLVVPVVGIGSTLYEYFEPSSALTIYEKTHSVSCSGQILESREERIFFCLGSGSATVLAMDRTFPLKFRTDNPIHIVVLGVLYGGGLVAWGYFLYGRLSMIAKWLRVT